MSGCPWPAESIDAYVDGTASDAERAATEMHLRACAVCRAETEAIGRLVERARRLPREQVARRDGWPALAGEMRRARWPHRLMSSGTVRLAAGFAIAAALGSAATIAVLDDRETPVAPIAAQSERPVAASLARIEREYAAVTRDLAAELEARRGTMSPEAVAVVERSIAVIDQAIAEARAALARDPDNALVARMLAASYEQKLDLLRRAARLSPGS